MNFANVAFSCDLVMYVGLAVTTKWSETAILLYGDNCRTERRIRDQEVKDGSQNFPRRYEMTTLLTIKVVCAVCQHISYFETVGSTVLCGSPDLDTRPPPMRRSTMHTWVQACPSCGYCAANLEEAVERTADIVHGETYQILRSQEHLPGNARDFMCQAYIAQTLCAFDKAAWATVFAAWICDDHDVVELSVEYRRQAANLAMLALLENQRLGRDIGATEGIRADLLRRAGQFEEAREVAQQGLDLELSEVMEQVLRYEIQLIDLQDKSCRTVAEAVQAIKIDVRDAPLVRRGDIKKQEWRDPFAPRALRLTKHVNLNTSLSEPEFLLLEEYLGSSSTPVSVMNMTMLDGYLAALASGPAIVLPDEMLRWVWETNEGTKTPSFKGRDEVELITGLILRYYYSLIYTLKDHVYLPRLFEDDYVSWCKGFVIGMTIELPDWMLLRSSNSELFITILKYGTADPDQLFFNDDPDVAVSSMTEAVARINAACAEQRLERLSRPVTPGRTRNWGSERSPNRVRRNDPCPCGSKREFKLCHGRIRKDH